MSAMATTQEASPTLETSVDSLAAAVEEATRNLLERLQQESDRQWSPRALMDAVKGGRTNTVMSMAFWELVNSNRITVDDRFVISLVDTPALS